MAYEKVKGDNTVLVVLNLASDSVSCEIKGIAEGIYTQWLDSRTIAQKIVKKDVELSETMTFSLPKKGYAVYVKRP